MIYGESRSIQALSIDLTCQNTQNEQEAL